MSEPTPTTPVADEPAPHARRAEIVTLPPLEIVDDSLPLSPRTGQPRRVPTVVAANIAWNVSALVVAICYARHWWAAAHAETFQASAWAIRALAPKPGDWPSLVLVSGLAALATATAAAAMITAFQAWNGWRWARIAGFVAIALSVGNTLVLDPTGALGWVGVALAVAGEVCLWLPQSSASLALWARFHAGKPPARRPDAPIQYGRLPRYR